MKTYKKIDLFFSGDYLCTTNQSKTCKEAKRRYLEGIMLHPIYQTTVTKRVAKHPELLKARFSK